MSFRKNIVLAGSLFLLNCGLNAQADTIAKRIVLIGDAGQLTNGNHPVVNAVRNLIPLDKNTTVLFLGDNLYRNGLPDTAASDYLTYRAVLDSQLSVAEGTAAQVIMIPGNHDWRNGNRDGYDAVVRQQFYVSFLNKPNVRYLPEEGCPGPEAVPIGDDIMLIIFDSQWWLHLYDKPEIESDCTCKTTDELVTQIRDIAVKNSKKLIIVASHHPFESNGPHGGYFQLKQHIFPFTDLRPNLYIPLPLLGSAYPLSRSVFGSPQDLKYPAYTNMINQVSDAVKSSATNVIFVAGHEHNLELIKDSSYYYIISGGGSKINRASSSKRSLFISPSTGFSVMEISKNKNVTVTFYTVTDSVRKANFSSLMNYSPAKAIDTITADVIAATNLPESVTRPASKQFPPISGLKKFFMGQNYRTEWSTPVHMRTLDIDKEKGGFTVAGLGGGEQTKSLRLKDIRGGKDWVLRGVEKNPAANIPAPFRNYVAHVLAKEINSASHPYGALIVPGLAKPLNIVVPEPELFFVEDDSRLKGYRKDFAGKVCLLEDRFTTYKGKDTKSSSKIFNEMIKDNDHRPYQPAVLTARLLDMLIGDYDRHFDQWKWYKSDTGKGVIYYPIARDRDQSFFYSNGNLLNLISRTIPFLKGFKKNIQDINWLGYTAKDFDRIFLTDLDAGEWKKSVADMQQKLTDSVIHAAVKRLPPEIYAIDGESIAEKLISRRNEMTQKAITYYNFISRKVNIIGSNQKEYFKISNYGAGLQVRVYERGRGNDTSFIMYNRIFDPSVTKEIRLYGLNDDDVFDIEENASSRIKFRIIGGNGNDTFNIRGNVENLLYDRTKPDLNVILSSNRSKKRFTIDPPANSRSLIGFNYNTTRFPQLIAGYNSDDEFILGLGYSRRTYGFMNPPYASDQHFSALYSTRGAWQFNYDGIFNHITRNTDVELHARYSSPALKNFFGLGNNTSTGQANFDFYRVHYKELEMEALLRHRYFERMHLAIGPYFYMYQSDFSDNSKTILASPAYRNDSANIFRRKSYLGGKFLFSFDNRNNEIFPTRGILWKNELLITAGMKGSSNMYSRITSDMIIYASQRDPAKVTAVIRFGGGRIFGNKFEYFQALDIGADILHGFRKNRYAGSSTLYGSFELRVKLLDINSYILPGQFGLSGYYNAGRVWMRGDNFNGWHKAFGGGVYFLPFNLFVISATAGFSEQERTFNFSLGSKFNLTF